MRITVLGSVNIDLAGQVPHLPRPGETLHGDELHTHLGGKGANQAVAVARLGAPVHFIARVGTDGFGRLARERLQALGVPTDAVATDAQAATGVALIQVDPQGRNTIAVFAGANAALHAEALAPHRQALAETRVLLLQLEIPLAASLAAAATVRAQGGLAILDPAPCPAAGLPEEVWSAVDVLTPNEVEAQALVGLPCDSLEGARRAGRAMLDRGAPRALIKLGARGALLLSRVAGEAPECAVPAFTVDAIDTVAAGDCFNGGLAVALHEGQAWPEAVRFASACAALSTTRRGAADSIPRRDEVDEFLCRQAHPAAPTHDH